MDCIRFALKQIERGNSLPATILLNTQKEEIIGRQTVISMANYHCVSRKHAVLRYISDTWYVRELEGKETYINFDKIGRKFHRLNVGDIIGFGAPFFNDKSEKNGFFCVLTVEHKVKQEVLDYNEDLASNCLFNTCNVSKSNDEITNFSQSSHSELHTQNLSLLEACIKQESSEDCKANCVDNSITFPYNLSNSCSESSIILKQNDLQYSEKRFVDQCVVDRNSLCSEDYDINNDLEGRKQISFTQYFIPKTRVEASSNISADGDFINCTFNNAQNVSEKDNESLVLDVKSQTLKSESDGYLSSSIFCVPNTKTAYYTMKINKSTDNIEERSSKNFASHVGSQCFKETNLTALNAATVNIQMVRIPHNTSHESGQNEKLTPKKLRKYSGIPLRDCSVILTRCDSLLNRNIQYFKNTRTHYKKRMNRNRILSSSNDDQNNSHCKTMSVNLLNKNISLKLKKIRIVSSESSESDQVNEERNRKMIRSKLLNKNISLKLIKSRIVSSESSESDPGKRNLKTINSSLLYKSISPKLKKRRIIHSESSENDKKRKPKTIGSNLLSTKISLRLKKNRIVSSESSESDQDNEKRNRKIFATDSSDDSIQIKPSKKSSGNSQTTINSSECFKFDSNSINQGTSNSHSSHQISEWAENTEKENFSNSSISAEPIHKMNYDSDSSVSSSSEIILYPSPYILDQIKKVTHDSSLKSLNSSLKSQQTNFKYLKNIEIPEICPRETAKENCTFKLSTDSEKRKQCRTKYLHPRKQFLNTSPTVHSMQDNADFSTFKSESKCHANSKKRFLKSNREITQHRNDRLPRAPENIMVGSSVKKYNYKIPKHSKSKNRPSASEVSNSQLNISKILKAVSVVNKSNTRISRMGISKNINSSPTENSSLMILKHKGDSSSENQNSSCNLNVNNSMHRSKSTIPNVTGNKQFPKEIFKKSIGFDESLFATDVIARKNTFKNSTYTFANENPPININCLINKQTVQNANDVGCLGKPNEIRSQTSEISNPIVEKNTESISNKCVFAVSRNEHQNNQIVEPSHCKFSVTYSPSLVELLIQWSPKWLAEQQDNTEPPPLIRNEVSALTQTFKNYSAYFTFFHSIIVLDMWELICRKSRPIFGDRFINWNNFYCIITSSFLKGNILELHCQSIVSDKLQHHPVEGNVVLLNVQDIKRKLENCVFGFVTQHELLEPTDLENSMEWQNLPRKWKTNARLCSFTILIKNRPISLATKSLMISHGIGNINLSLFLMDSLCNLRFSPLCELILQPKQNNWCSTKVPTDLSQQNFIQYMCNEIIEYNMHPQIFLLQGTPGTGKTYSVLKLVEMLLFSNTSNLKLLICAPTDSVLDEIGMRIIELKERCSWRSNPINFIRIGYSDHMNPKLHHYHLDTIVSKRFKIMFERYCLSKEKKQKNLERKINREIHLCKTQPNSTKTQQKLKDLMSQYESLKVGSLEDLESNLRSDCKSVILEEAEIILSTLACCRDHVFNHVTCCIVDSASLCMEPEVLPCLTPGVHKLVLVGDTKQRKPAKCFQLTDRYGHRKSLFERFYDCFKNEPEYPILNLKMQHRMHSEICHFPSRYFYTSEIETSPETIKRFQYFPLKPYVVIDVLDSQSSSVNECVAKDIFNHICCHINKTVSGVSIGAIVDPSHVNLYKNFSSEFKNIEVNSVDCFYNKEKDVIIMAFVETTHSNEFMASNQEFNIALTRARQCLIIYGHLSCLVHHKHWKELLNDAKVRNIYKSVPLVTPKVLKKLLSNHIHTE